MFIKYIIGSSFVFDTFPDTSLLLIIAILKCLVWVEIGGNSQLQFFDDGLFKVHFVFEFCTFLALCSLIPN